MKIGMQRLAAKVPYINCTGTGYNLLRRCDVDDGPPDQPLHTGTLTVNLHHKAALKRPTTVTDVRIRID